MENKWISKYFSAVSGSQTEIIRQAMESGYNLEERLSRAMRFLFRLGEGGGSPDSKEYYRITQKEEIWLSPGEVPEEDPAWECFINLKCLGLSECNLKSVPSHLSTADCIEILHLDGNPGIELAEVWPVISKMRGLKELYFWNCDLKKIPEGLANLPHLEKLEFNYNEGLNITGSISWLKDNAKVINLSLEGCGIEILPANLSGLEHLQFLNLADNKIHEIPASFKELKSLEEVILSGNPVFDQLEELETLFRSGCFVF